MTIADIVRLPAAHSASNNEESESFLHPERRSWREVTADDSEGDYMTVFVRICARITQVSPCDSKMLTKHLLIVCPTCKVAEQMDTLGSDESRFVLCASLSSLIL